MQEVDFSEKEVHGRPPCETSLGIRRNCKARYQKSPWQRLSSSPMMKLLVGIALVALFAASAAAQSNDILSGVENIGLGMFKSSNFGVRAPYYEPRNCLAPNITRIPCVDFCVARVQAGFPRRTDSVDLFWIWDTEETFGSTLHTMENVGYAPEPDAIWGFSPRLLWISHFRSLFWHKCNLIGLKNPTLDRFFPERTDIAFTYEHQRDFLPL